MLDGTEYQNSGHPSNVGRRGFFGARREPVKQLTKQRRIPDEDFDLREKGKDEPFTARGHGHESFERGHIVFHLKGDVLPR